MLTIDSEPCVSGHDTSLGAISNVRLEGPHLRVGPEDQIVAQLKNHTWHCDGQTYAVLRIASRVRVRFDDEVGAVTYGPYDHLRLVDGFIRCGAKLDETLAHYDERKGLWFAHPENRYCAAVIVEQD